MQGRARPVRDPVELPRVDVEEVARARVLITDDRHGLPVALEHAQAWTVEAGTIDHRGDPVGPPAGNAEAGDVAFGRPPGGAG